MEALEDLPPRSSNPPRLSLYDNIREMENQNKPHQPSLVENFHKIKVTYANHPLFFIPFSKTFIQTPKEIQASAIIYHKNHHNKMSLPNTLIPYFLYTRK